MNLRSRPEPLTDQSSSILFVLGAARSGTTHLNLVLDRNFGFGMGPEGQFVAEFAKKLARYGDLNRHSNAQRLAEDLSRSNMVRIIRDRWPEDIRFDITSREILEQVPEPSYAGFVYSVFKCVALGQNKPNVGNKNPSYWQQLPLLHSLFPTQAKYIAIVRDGRDVALSTMKTSWGEKSAYICAISWVRSLQAVENFRQTAGDDRVIQIRYEDLLSNPIGTMKSMSVFLNIEPDPIELNMFIERTEESKSRFNLYKWKNTMSKEDLRLFEAQASFWLRKFGYETAYENPTIQWHEKARLLGAEGIRRLKLTAPTRSVS